MASAMVANLCNKERQTEWYSGPPHSGYEMYVSRDCPPQMCIKLGGKKKFTPAGEISTQWGGGGANVVVGKKTVEVEKVPSLGCVSGTTVGVGIMHGSVVARNAPE